MADITRTPAIRQLRTGQWLWLDHAAFDAALAIDATTLAVYVTLCRYASAEQECYPSIATLNKHVQARRRTLLRSLKKLEQIGLIEVVRRRNEAGAKTSNLYRLLTVPPSDLVTPGNQGRCHTGTIPSVTGEPYLVSHGNQELTVEELTVEEQERENFVLFGAAAPDRAPKVDPHLLNLIDMWNRIAPEMNAPKVRRDPPSKDLLKAWKRTSKDSDLQEGFSDLPALEAALRKAVVCHGEPWFDLGFLFTSDKESKQLRVQRILNGRYVSNGSNGKQRESEARFRGKHGAAQGDSKW